MFKRNHLRWSSAIVAMAPTAAILSVTALLAPTQAEAVQRRTMLKIIEAKKAAEAGGPVLSPMAMFAPKPAPVIAEIESLALEPGCANRFCGGKMRIAGQEVIIPKNLLIDLPANRMTLKDLFDNAPVACKALGQSGLAKADTCLGGAPGFYATVHANRSDCREVIAADIFIVNGPVAITGEVTFISYVDGYFEVNGTPGVAGSGSMVRLNDPTSRHTIQSGPGCGAGPNCSPDIRFNLDSDNYTAAFRSGYPLCLPSRKTGGLRTVGADANGAGDPFCPVTNRAQDPVQDSTRFAPLLIGDVVVVEGGNVTVNGVKYVSAHTVTVEKGLSTRDAPDQPDYVVPGEAEFDMGNFPRQRARARFLGNSTLPDSQLDIFSMRVDPRDNESHEDTLTSTVGNPRTFLRQIGGGGGIWRINLDVDFLDGVPVRPTLSPCTHLRNAGIDACPQGGTLVEEFSLLAPVPREIVVRTRHKQQFPNNISRDLNGNEAPNGEFLMPLGIGLGGFEIPVPDEFNLDFGVVPIIFEAFPWMLDRRLSPGGCLETGCELGPQPLAPFPVSKLDPRGTDNLVPAEAANRVITYFTAESTGLVPHLIASFPPVDSCSPAPTAIPDAFQLAAGGTLELNVLANDVGTINPSTVQIVTQPANGTAQVNPSGTITYTANSGFVGTDSFTYRVASANGGWSAPATVSLTMADTVSVTTAQYRIFPRRWTVSGSVVSRISGTTVTVYAGATVGGTVIGTAAINAADGTWSVVQNNSAVPVNTRVSVQTSTGARLENVAVNVTN